MLKLRSISKLEFDNFTQKQTSLSHFMQTSSWGEFYKITNHTTPFYLGLINEKEEIIAATLIIEEHLPMNYCTLYAPRGFIIDYKDKRLITIFTQKIRDFAIQKKALAIRINPGIITKAYDSNKKKFINNNADKIIQNLKNLGYKKRSKTKMLDYNYVIDLNQNYNDIYNKYDQKIKTYINDTNKYDIELIVGTNKDLEELYNLDEKYKSEYYDTLYDIFNNNDTPKIKMFLCKLHITKTIKNIEKDLNKINNQISLIAIDNLDKTSKERLTKLKETKELLNNEYEKFKKYKLDYGNTLTICSNLIMEYNNNACILSESKHKVIEETNLSYKVYDEYIKYYKNNNFNELKQLSPIENNYNINEFTKNFGSKFIAYIGDYDLIVNPFLYFILLKIIPIFKKQEDKNETNNSK